MSAELLREAATKMRQRAQAATPGPWFAVGAAIAVEVEHCTCGVSGEIGRLYGHEPLCRLDGPVMQLDERDAEHVAGWHPGVALAVADWLDAAASNHEALGYEGEGMPGSPLARAFAVARAYLGVQP